MQKTNHFSRILRLSNILHKCYEPNPSTPRSKKFPSIDFTKIILLILGIFIAIGLFAVTYANAELISLLGGASILLPAIFLIAGISAIFFSFVELIGTLYMSSDLSALIVLPFSPLEIVVARILGCLRTVIPVSTIVILPTILGFGLSENLDFFYYFVSILALISIPLFSVLVTTSVIILLMTFVRIFRNKDILTILGAIFAVLIIIFSNTTNNNETSEEIGVIFANSLGNISNFSAIIPIAPLLANLYKTGNFLYFLAFFGTLLGTLTIFVILVKAFYLKGALSVHTGRTKTKNVSLDKSAKKSNSISRTLLKRELKTIFRTPAFYVNGWLLPFVWPVLMITPIISSKEAIESGLEAALSATGSDFSTVIPYALSAICIAALFFSLMPCVMCNLAYTSISREGSSFFFTKTYPINYKTQLKAKLNLSLIITSIGSTILTLATSIFMISLGILPFYGIFAALLVNFSTIYLLNSIELYFGVKKPNLTWTNIAIIGKLGHVPFILLGILAVLAICGLSVAGLIFTSPLLVLGFYIIFIPAISVLLSHFLMKRSVKHLANL